MIGRGRVGKRKKGGGIIKGSKGNRLGGRRWEREGEQGESGKIN